VDRSKRARSPTTGPRRGTLSLTSETSPSSFNSHCSKVFTPDIVHVILCTWLCWFTSVTVHVILCTWYCARECARVVYQRVQGAAVLQEARCRHRAPQLLLLHGVTPLRQTLLLLLLWGHEDKMEDMKTRWRTLRQDGGHEDKMEAVLMSLLLWVSSLYFFMSLLLKSVSIRMSSRKNSFTSNCLPTTGHTHQHASFINH